MIAKKRIQQRITAGRFVLPVVMILSLAIWIGVYIIKPIDVFKVSSSPVWQLIEPFFLGKPLSLVINFILYAFIAYFLIELNNAFAIIRLRASIQTSLYLILIAVCPELYTLHVGTIVTLCVSGSLFFLYRSYQQSRSSADIFYSWMLLGLGSLIFPQLLYLVPVYLIGAYNFQSLNPRSFFAGIIGLSFPYWFLLGYALIFNRLDMFYHPFMELVNFAPIDFLVLKSWQIATICYVILLFLVAVAHSLINGWQDKIRARAYLNFFSLLGISLAVGLILQPQHFITIFPLFLVSFSFLVGHFFVLTHSKASNLFFLFSLIGLGALLGFNLWTL